VIGAGPCSDSRCASNSAVLCSVRATAPHRPTFGFELGWLVAPRRGIALDLPHRLLRCGRRQRTGSRRAQGQDGGTAWTSSETSPDFCGGRLQRAAREAFRTETTKQRPKASAPAASRCRPLPTCPSPSQSGSLLTFARVQLSPAQSSDDTFGQYAPIGTLELTPLDLPIARDGIPRLRQGQERSAQSNVRSGLRKMAAIFCVLSAL
jgi:hypothetical protein